MSKQINGLLKYGLPDKLIVQIDTREKYPLLFPSHIVVDNPLQAQNFKQILRVPVATESIKLDAGDYRLKNYPDLCVVERKASVLELLKNFYDPKDQIRQAKAFNKLAKVKHPVLLLELSPSQILRSSDTVYPEKVMHRLCRIVAKYNFNLLWASRSSSTTSRRALGTAVVHLMLGYAMRQIQEQNNK